MGGAVAKNSFVLSFSVSGTFVLIRAALVYRVRALTETPTPSHSSAFEPVEGPRAPSFSARPPSMSQNVPSLSTAVHDAWDRHVEKSLSTDEGPSVLALLAQADEAGKQHSLRTLIPAVAAQCETPSIQQAWADWTAVTDREELRLRLETMCHFDTLDPALHPFVLFFFRASDPVLYQVAARVLGTHLEANTELGTYLDDFAASRGIDPTAPVVLRGTRTRRRLLIALAAHRATGATVPVLDASAPESHLDLSPLDLNAVLAATRIVVDRFSTTTDWEHLGLTLLDGIADRSPVDRADPSLLRSWGLLFATLGNRHPERTTAAWSALLGRLWTSPDQEIHSFPDQLQRLARLDEVVHGAALLPASAQQRVHRSLPRSLGPYPSLFVRYRWSVWTERERTNPPDSLLNSLSSATTEANSVLGELVRAETGSSPTPSGFEDGPRSSRRLTAFVHLVSAMGDKPTWFRHSVEQRALVAFSALDLSRHLPLPSTAVDAAFDHFAFPRLRATEEPSRTVPLPNGRAGPATYRMLLRLADWEETSAGRLVGTTLLHQITEPQVLLMLLPSHEASEWTAALADAAEHRLRLHLRTRADFSPEQFLYETSVRAPHPQFYDHLHHLCEGRTYQDTKEREVPIRAIVERLRDEVRATTDGSPAARPSGEAAWPGNPEFARNLSHVRQTLSAVLTLPDPIEALDTMVDVLDPKSKDPETGSRGLVGLLSLGRSPSAPLVSRTRGTAPPSLQTVREHLQTHVLRLRETIPHLQPRTFREAHGVRDDALEIEDALEAIEQHVVPILGMVEATLLTSVFDHLKTRLQAWTDALTSLQAQWRDFLDDGIDPFAEADPLLKRVLERSPGPLRTRLLDLLARTLTIDPPLDPGDAPSSDEWAREYRLLEWALAPAQRNRLTEGEGSVWTAVFATHWDQLAAAAMEAGHESRVRRLTTHDGFSELYDRPSLSDTLETARSWFLDRYHAPAVHQITTIQRSVSWTRGVASTMSSFLAHFSRVWLALLLGAILMLDFGDAWTAMAEGGAVGSVAVTFIVGVLGTLGYLFVDLRSKVERAPEESVWQARRSQWARVVAFLGACLLVTVGITTMLWFLLSGTGAVIEGSGAALHVVVWTGFALFVGVFFGLIAETT